MCLPCLGPVWISPPPLQVPYASGLSSGDVLKISSRCFGVESYGQGEGCLFRPFDPCSQWAPRKILFKDVHSSIVYYKTTSGLSIRNDGHKM